jgi:gliding motility-associated-like protein
VSAPVCQRSESFTFTVDFEDCGCQWFMPNVFSPNGDGINDDFGPEGECQVTDYELQIFDRWGQSVFLSRNRDQRWNGRVRGTPAANGVYVYRWRYRLLETGEWVETSGSVTIVR